MGNDDAAITLTGGELAGEILLEFRAKPNFGVNPSAANPSGRQPPRRLPPSRISSISAAEVYQDLEGLQIKSIVV